MYLYLILELTNEHFVHKNDLMIIIVITNL